MRVLLVVVVSRVLAFVVVGRCCGASAACTTDATGRCSIKTANLSKQTPTVEVRVTSVAVTGRSYSPTANHDPDPTGSITVNRP